MVLAEMEWLPGQKVRSQLEPDLGAGTVSQVQGRQWVEVTFARAQVARRYSCKNPPLIPLKFSQGELIKLSSGTTHRVLAIKQHLGLMCYKIDDTRWIVENEIEDTAQAQGAEVKLFRGEWSRYKAFRLRLRLLKATFDTHDPSVMGMRSARVDLHPHQLYLASSLASRWTPRAILADEVGLGKTIEAALILSALRARGFAERCLITCPESLQFQWLSELYRRFAINASLLLNEDLEEATEERNLFEESSVLVVSHEVLQKIYNTHPKWFNHTEWDLCIVDEAHRFTRPLSDLQNPDDQLLEKNIIEVVCDKSRGALLLTASPMHRGVFGLYQLLRSLDSLKYNDFRMFQDEMTRSKRLAPVAQKLYSETYSPTEIAQIKRAFTQDADILSSIEKLEKNKDPDEILRKLSDRHFLGRYFFQNRRERLLGFPKRQIQIDSLIPLPETKKALLQAASEIHDNSFEKLHELATSSVPGTPSSPSKFLGFKEKIEWLMAHLKKLNPKVKALILTAQDEDARQIHKILVEKLHARIGIFHSQMNMIERDKQAAWFSDESGAQFMVASEIGGEGRNFQMASHLFMMDLPSNPETIEQRIGRLDRLGQRFPIHIHIAALKNFPEDVYLNWCDLGVSMLRAPAAGIMAIFEKVRPQIEESYLEVISNLKSKTQIPHPRTLQPLLKATHHEHAKWIDEVRNSSNVLIDLNSFREVEGRRIKTILESQTTQNTVLGLTQELMNHFGIEHEELDRADVLRLQANAQMFIEEYPELPLDQDVVVSTRRTLCLEREDFRFLSPDHPIFTEGMDLFLRSHQGQATCAEILNTSIPKGLYIHCVFAMSEAIPHDIKGLVQMDPIEIVLSATGDHLDWTALGDLQVRDWSTESELAYVEDIQSPLEDLIETAKAKTQITFKRRLEESLSRSLKVIKERQSQFKYLTSIGQSPHPKEVEALDQILGRVESLRTSAKPYLDSIAVLIKS
jgi:ATP-dependent helicase HepA